MRKVLWEKVLDPKKKDKNPPKVKVSLDRFSQFTYCIMRKVLWEKVLDPKKKDKNPRR
jgi:hypothetical protein